MELKASCRLADMARLVVATCALAALVAPLQVVHSYDRDPSDLPPITKAFFATKEVPTNLVVREYDLTWGIKKGVSVMKGVAKIAFKLTRTKSAFHMMLDKFKPECCKEPGWTDDSSNILLQMSAELVLTGIKMSVAESMGELLMGKGKILAIRDIQRHPDEPFARIRLQKSLPFGQYGMLWISYDNPMSNVESKMIKGEIYNPVDKRMETYRALHLEPGHASSLFPCFDAPVSTSDFILRIDQNLHPPRDVYSGQASVSYFNDRQPFGAETRFATTSVSAPAHTLRLVMGKYPTSETRSFTMGQKDEPNVVRVYEPPGHQGEGRFALAVAIEVWRWLMQYLPPLTCASKSIDFLPVPSNDKFNVSTGAGIVLVNHEFLLIDEELSSPERKTETAINVALGVARQWFGTRLVASERKHLWITEGLAFHMALKALRELHPDYEVMQHVETHHRALVSDYEQYFPCKSISSTSRRQELEPGFSLTRLVRGAQIFDLLQRDILGGHERHFYDIMREFIVTNVEHGIIDLDGLVTAFSTMDVEPSVLHRVLRRRLLCGRDAWVTVKDVFHLVDVGFNHISVDPMPVSVKMDFYNGNGTKRATKQVVNVTDCLNDRHNIRVAKPDWFNSSALSDDWFKVSLDQPGAMVQYRVRYARDALQILNRPLMAGLLSRQERINLLSTTLDYWMVSRWQVDTYKHANTLEIVLALLQNDTDPEVLYELLRVANVYDALNFGTRMRDVISGTLARLRGQWNGFADSDDGKPTISEQRLRGAVASTLVDLDDARTIAEARRVFESSIEPKAYFRNAMYKALAKSSIVNLRELLTERLERCGLAEERARIRGALGDIENKRP